MTSLSRWCGMCHRLSCEPLQMLVLHLCLRVSGLTVERGKRVPISDGLLAVADGPRALAIDTAAAVPELVAAPAARRAVARTTRHRQNHVGEGSFKKRQQVMLLLHAAHCVLLTCCRQYDD